METIIGGILIGIGIIIIILMCILHDADFFKRIGNVIELKSETKKNRHPKSSTRNRTITISYHGL